MTEQGTSKAPEDLVFREEVNTCKQSELLIQTRSLTILYVLERKSSNLSRLISGKFKIRMASRAEYDKMSKGADVSCSPTEAGLSYIRTIAYIRYCCQHLRRCFCLYRCLYLYLHVRRTRYIYAHSWRASRRQLRHGARQMIEKRSETCKTHRDTRDRKRSQLFRFDVRKPRAM